MRRQIILAWMSNFKKQEAMPLDRQTFCRLIDSDQTLRVVRQIERTADYETKKEIKENLPVAFFCCQYLEGGKRPKAGLPIEPSGLCIHDWDKMEVDPRQFFTDNIKGREEELGITLAHITPRGCGLRLITEMQPGEDMIKCQARFAEMFGMQKYADAKIKDITRLSWIPSREYFLYINYEKTFERTIEVDEDEKAEVTSTEVSSVSEPQQLSLFPSETSASANTESKTNAQSVMMKKEADKSFAMSFEYEGIKYDRIITEILNRLATDGHPQEGERNNDLFALVRELRHVTQYNFEITRMLVTPYFSDLKDSEIRSTINSAISTNGRTITPTMKGIIDQLKNEDMVDEASEENDLVWPKMPQLPPFMEMICSKFPKNIRPQVALSMLPILGTYGTHIRFRYCDNRMNSLSFQVAVVGKSGRGKAFASHLYDMLTPKFEELDKVERQKDQEYQDKLNKRKDKDAYPEDPRAKVRLFSDEITTSMMLEYLDNLNGEHGLQFTEEVARLCKAKKTHYGDNDDLYCKAFDNAIGGKESKNRQTRNIRIPIYLNTLFCGTPNSMHNFYNNPEGGLNNRVIFAALPQNRHKGIPRYDDLTEEEMKLRDEMLDKLYAYGTGDDEKEFEFPFLDKAANAFIRKCDKEDDENPNETWRDLANRAAVMGYRAGALAYFLWGRPTDEKTIKQVVKFANWVTVVARISVYNFCGDEYEHLNELNSQTKTRQTKNKKLFSLLPNKFTAQDVVCLRVKNGDSTDVRMVLSRWSNDGLIRKNDDGKTYSKIKTVS